MPRSKFFITVDYNDEDANDDDDDAIGSCLHDMFQSI